MNADVLLYTVTLSHPSLDGALVMDVPALSQAKAISRARVTAVHMYRHVELMDSAATCTAGRPLE